ncbi:FdhF/YdeP family oxidoreductase [Halomonas getboli]|uniref:FdhF/YdeP family oxidoreductase n=1 Tax=Halomonas getboli TaxID=2935862 RepID=UPI001FFE7706|nr:FdhF/YdeP family oxidoreductase [Halomonas getboli]MCK2183685.1 FdhF/YdeP family oxidoreductase [Halomonas getboli]
MVRGLHGGLTLALPDFARPRLSLMVWRGADSRRTLTHLCMEPGMSDSSSSTSSDTTPPHVAFGTKGAHAPDLDPGLAGSQLGTPPGGGWPSLKAVETFLWSEHLPVKGHLGLLKMNQPDGFICPSCAWPNGDKPKRANFCENGAKALAWEATSKRLEDRFLADHTLSELREWTDHQLEREGRLTRPLRYDAEQDRYVPASWAAAYAEIGQRLKGYESPNQVEFYTSGRTSNEAAFLFSLLGRLYGTNNFPDCSNMCHETTSRALPESIGLGKATVNLDDFSQADAIFIFGQNSGTNSPRMLGDLHAARARGAEIVSFNPLRERALIRFADPQSAKDMLGREGTEICTQYHQLRIGGDLAAIQAMCKYVIEADDARRRDDPHAAGYLDHAFIAQHCHGFEAFADYCRALSWDDLVGMSGLSRESLQQAAQTYLEADRVICCWGMGITQHARGGDTIQQIINLLLLRGNIGRPGAGACPVRGHSNVQGDRTVGIENLPKPEMLDAFDRVFDMQCPRDPGHDVAECCEAILRGEVKAFIGMGGNFFRAIPDQQRVVRRVGELDMTVHIATKLNRSHLHPGRHGWVLPTLGHSERDRQAGPDGQGAEQVTSVEDGMCNVSPSRGMLAPADPSLPSEIAITCQLAKATLPAHPSLDWDWLQADYARIRDRIEAVFPQIFPDYNARLAEGGFRIRTPPRERIWPTDSGRANFLFPDGLGADEPGLDKVTHETLDRNSVFLLITLRGHDQFNTTVYSEDDRYRDVYGTRMVVMISPQDLEALGFTEGQRVRLETASEDGLERGMSGFRLKAYDIPSGCLAAYYPETNDLIPLDHRDARSNTPASKSVPVRLRPMDAEEVNAREGVLASV